MLDVHLAGMRRRRRQHQLGEKLVRTKRSTARTNEEFFKRNPALAGWAEKLRARAIRLEGRQGVRGGGSAAHVADESRTIADLDRAELARRLRKAGIFLENHGPGFDRACRNQRADA